jgi:Platelet-activating factor acetylhydrolase, isoform II
MRNYIVELAYIAGLFWSVTSASSTPINLPSLDGPYKVGTSRVQVTDLSRLDPYAPSPEPRSLMLQIWYPIWTHIGLKRAPYIPGSGLEFLEERWLLPQSANYTIITDTWLEGKPIRAFLAPNSTLPVAVFDPGLGAVSAFYTTYCSSLASQGYIVVGVDHPYDSSPILLANGTMIGTNIDTSSLPVALKAVEVRRDDLLFLSKQITVPALYDWIPGLNKTGWKRPTGVRVSLFGQSLGGQAAAATMENQPSPYLGVMSLDSPFSNASIAAGFYGPFYYLSSQNSVFADLLAKQWETVKGWKVASILNGTTHYSFTDLEFIVPHANGTILNAVYAPIMGGITPARNLKVVNHYIKSFFDWTIMGKSEAKHFLEEQSLFYPDVRLDETVSQHNISRREF